MWTATSNSTRKGDERKDWLGSTGPYGPYGPRLERALLGQNPITLQAAASRSVRHHLHSNALSNCASLSGRGWKRAMTNGVDRRAQIDNETVKGLLLLNGGGAVALLSAFSALVGKEGFEPLLSAILWAVFGMMLGSVWAIFHNHYRRKCSLHYELHKMSPP